MKRRDLTGARYGKLLVVSMADNNGRFTQWNCLCDCGNIAVVATAHLTNGHTKSCGCLRSETASANFSKHRKSNTRLYRIWRNMKTRCKNSKCDHYHLYGGRRIYVCDEWCNDFSAFEEWVLNHGYQDNLSIDGIDVNGPYAPDNCRFVTMKEQENNKRTNHYVCYKGEQKTFSELSDDSGIPYDTLLARINSQHWSVERAVSAPIQYHKAGG